MPITPTQVGQKDWGKWAYIYKYMYIYMHIGTCSIVYHKLHKKCVHIFSENIHRRLFSLNDSVRLQGNVHVLKNGPVHKFQPYVVLRCNAKLISIVICTMYTYSIYQYTHKRFTPPHRPACRDCHVGPPAKGMGWGGVG